MVECIRTSCSRHTDVRRGVLFTFPLADHFSRANKNSPSMHRMKLYSCHAWGNFWTQRDFATCYSREIAQKMAHACSSRLGIDAQKEKKKNRSSFICSWKSLASKNMAFLVSAADCHFDQCCTNVN